MPTVAQIARRGGARRLKATQRDDQIRSSRRWFDLLGERREIVFRLRASKASIGLQLYMLPRSDHRPIGGGLVAAPRGKSDFVCRQGDICGVTGLGRSVERILHLARRGKAHRRDVRLEVEPPKRDPVLGAVRRELCGEPQRAVGQSQCSDGLCVVDVAAAPSGCDTPPLE